MKKLIILTISLFFLAACEKESEEKDPVCTVRWELEINNPESRVYIDNGDLIIEIDNPRTMKDVRLIQRQRSYFPDQAMNFYIEYEDLTSKYFDSELMDPTLSASLAYSYKPDSIFLGAQVGKWGGRLDYNGTYRQNLGNSPIPSTTGEIFLEAHNDLDVNITAHNEGGGVGYFLPTYTLQPDPMTFYLDFGVNQIFKDRSAEHSGETLTYQSQSISIRIKHVRFKDAELAVGLNELQNDEFTCESWE